MYKSTYSPIGLINTYSTLNVGDAAIYSAIAALTPPEKVLARFADCQPQRLPGVQILEKLPRCGVYISVGGDIFNNARESLVTKAFVKNVGALWRSPQQTFLFGQSIPRSCHGLSFQLLAQSLRRLAAVCVRDAESFKRLTQAGVQAKLSFDVVFSALVNETAKHLASLELVRQGVNPDKAALISLRGFDTMYAHNNEQFANLLVRLCQVLQQRGHQPVLLLQAQAYGADNDHQMAQQVVQAVPNVAVFDPFAQAWPMPQWQVVMGALAIARLAIGVRYHTSVFRLAAGRMPFNLYYSNKGRDLTQRLGIPGCDLAKFDPNEQLLAIEQTAEQSFDHVALRQKVKSDFQACYQRAACA